MLNTTSSGRIKNNHSIKFRKRFGTIAILAIVPNLFYIIPIKEPNNPKITVKIIKAIGVRPFFNIIKQNSVNTKGNKLGMIVSNNCV